MKRARVLHPFLFPLFPVLALYAHNIKSMPVPPEELVGPLIVSLGCALALFVVLRAITGDAAKSGLLVSLLLLWLLSYGHLAGAVAEWTAGVFSRSLLFATVLAIGLIVFLIVRSRRDLGGLTRFLNVVAATLVLLNVASTAQSLVRRTHSVVAQQIKRAEPAASRPNIFYIVLDAYTRADVLQEVFSFDNSGFLSGLEARGFTIASRSYANYGWTYHSLASSLNMAYLDDVAKRIRDTTANQEPLYRMIQENQAMAFLKSLGYEILALSTGFKAGDIKHVDRPLGAEGARSEFRSALLNTTIWPQIFGSRDVRSSYRAHREQVLEAFRVLEEYPLPEGPFFFFVHIMAPHPPFVFGPDGEPVEPEYLFTLVDADRLHGGQDRAVGDYIVRYREQLSFLNKKLLRAIDAIRDRSPEPPVIIVQGDHGSRAYASLDRPEACYLKENLAILSAYHLPGAAPGLVYPAISPVNTFRLVFARYLGAELELLEDRSSWCTWRQPYSFFPFDESSYQASVDSVRAATRPVAPAARKR